MAHKALRVLILEDVATDAELMVRELRKAGFRCKTLRVDNREDFTAALNDFAPELILADYKLPDFDGLSAFAIAREKAPIVPFIFVTGAMGEDFAIDTLIGGATDYVLKNHLAKLAPAVERALKEADAMAKRRSAEEALRRRLDEVERLNRLMVGREIRMVEMKREIAALKKQVQELQARIEAMKKGQA